MRRRLWTTLGTIVLTLVLLFSMFGAGAVYAQPPIGRVVTYLVTIQNLTDGQPMTPPAVVTHSGAVDLFEVGEPANMAVQQVAENGNYGPLLELLASAQGVFDYAVADAPLVPGNDPGETGLDSSVTLMVRAGRGARFLSVIAMLICTNDGFTGLDSIRLPRFGSRVYLAQAYDAGTEINTEDFADLVPVCPVLTGAQSDEAGATESNPALAENGVIMHHPGILGVADLDPALHGWDTDAPVAKITVTVISDNATRFLAPLTGEGEVVVEEDGSYGFVHTDAAGRAWFWLEPDEMTLSYRLEVRFLNDAFAAHIHVGSPAENGPVLVPLFTGPTVSRAHGLLASGSIAEEELPDGLTFEGFLAAMRAGEYYVNVHTTEHPGGEIRGQIGAMGALRQHPAP